jgi:hypothetical protein
MVVVLSLFLDECARNVYNKQVVRGVETDYYKDDAGRGFCFSIHSHQSRRTK